MDAPDILALLALGPHPEGGWFRETWRTTAGTAIYYLLEEHQRSHWHRIAADEVWHFYAGDPLELAVSADGVAEDRFVLGPDLEAGHHPQHVVPASAWQAARSLGRWTLVGCTVAPAFDFAGFELAPSGWRPSDSVGRAQFQEARERAMTDESAEEAQDGQEGEEEELNDPLTHSDEDPPRMPFGADPESEE